ncbi:ribonuclease P [Candidatus Bathyarchaeota archaeon]|nr:ribonuclease P [Candidatus Bathyarchaeota archaeon]
MSHRDQSFAQIAEERIELLYRFAREVFGTHPSLAKRYVEIARRIGMRCRVRIPRELKRFTCKGCGSLLVPGTNCRVRIKPDRGTILIMTCLSCGKLKRYPMARERRALHRAPCPVVVVRP